MTIGPNKSAQILHPICILENLWIIWAKKRLEELLPWPSYVIPACPESNRIELIMQKDPLLKDLYEDIVWRIPDKPEWQKKNRVEIGHRQDSHIFTGGEAGIRTLGGVAPTTIFETVPFNRSGTSPLFEKNVP